MTNKMHNNMYKEGAPLEEVLGSQLIDRGLTLSTAESCTGGLLAGRIVNVAGISQVFQEGFITYSNEAKEKLLGVSHDTLARYGAVSEETAREMAAGCARVAGTDIGIGVTGIAGPDGGSPEKPVGLVYIGIFIAKDAIKPSADCRAVQKNVFKGNRGQIREQAVEQALFLLQSML